MAMEDLIPVVNSGSSSIKFSAYDAMDGILQHLAPS
jgi:acetate kinase